MKILLHVNYFEGADKFETLLKIARVNGCDGVELRGYNFYGMEKEDYYAMLADLKQKNPEMTFAFSYLLNITGSTPDSRARELDEFAAFINWANANCGAKLINMFTGALVAPGKTFMDFSDNGSAAADDEMFAMHGQALTAAGREAEKLGMLIALESHNSYIHDIAAACAKLLTFVDSDAVGINYDHGNIILNSRGEKIDQVVNLLDGRIYYAHLKNVIKTSAGDYAFTHLDSGYINTHKVLCALKDRIKSGMLALEYPCSGDGIIAAKRDMEYMNYLKEWI